MISDDPGTEHYNIGDTLRVKGFYDDSITELLHAITLQETRLGSKNIALAPTHLSLGLAYRANKNFRPAMKHLNTAREIYELPKSEPENYKEEIKNCKLNLARTHHSRGVYYQRKGDYDSSILEHRKAIAIRESILGRSHLETARSHYVMGCALSDRGDFDEAMAELRRALRTRLKVFGKDHGDTIEVVENIATVLHAKGTDAESIAEYKSILLRSLEYETEGDVECRKGKLDHGIIYYKKAISLEMQVLGDLHPTTSDLYLRIAEALCEDGDLEGSLVEYKSAITIYENMLGKFHVKMGHIYTRIAGVLMDKGEYETALSFYAKAYGIFDGTLGLHDDTKKALMNVKLAAEKNRNAKSSMAILVKAEEAFRKRHPSASNDGDSSNAGEARSKKSEKKKKKKKKKDKKEKEEEKQEEAGEEPEPEPDII